MEISKPDFQYVWASGGAIVAPSNVKIQTGWTAEVPPFQWENWSQNRQDQAIAHILQHGIAVWDAVTEYQAGKSYIQGTNGSVYRAIQTHTGQNPISTSGYWEIAFADLKSFTGANQLFAVNGFQKFPGGLIIQWGTKVCTYDSTSAGGFANSVTYPTAFTSPPTINITRTQGLNTGAVGNPDQLAATATTTGFLILGAQASGTNNYTVAWTAIGY